MQEDGAVLCLLNVLALTISGPHCPVVMIPVEEITSPAPRAILYFSTSRIVAKIHFLSFLVSTLWLDLISKMGEEVIWVSSETKLLRWIFASFTFSVLFCSLAEDDSEAITDGSHRFKEPRSLNININTQLLSTRNKYPGPLT